jgi:hypothetical protein
MFEYLTNVQRIELAKAKTERVLNHLLYVLGLHANNDFVVYTSVLSRQIPKSYAANAFSIFQRAMYQIEIVRLCALWDSPADNKENITTVVELIDDNKIIETLMEETRRHWADQPASVLNPAIDPELAEIERDGLRAINVRFGEEQAVKARNELTELIEATRAIQSSPRLVAVMNTRDKHLAHSLTETRREKRGPVNPMKNADAHWILLKSIPIVERLYCWVNGKSFSIEESIRIDNEYAQALWGGCKFNVLR